MDYFRTNWSKTMQQNPTANFLLNNGYKVKKWAAYQPSILWNDPTQGRNATTTMQRLNEEWKYAEDTDNVPPIYSTNEKFGFITKAELKKNKHFNILKKKTDNIKGKYNVWESKVGANIGEYRMNKYFPPETVILGLDEYDMAVREDNDFPQPSFWVNTAPVTLYKNTNSQLRPNPFASISASPIQVSTPLITFSS